MNSEPTPRTDAARESYIHPILMQIRWAVDIELARTIELELIASNKRVVELEKDKEMLDWVLNWNVDGHPFKDRQSIDTAMHNQKESEG